MFRTLTRPRRVVITGMGCVTPLGIGREAFWTSLLEGKSGTRKITAFDPSTLPVQIAAEVPDFDPEIHLAGISLDMLDRFSQLALVAGAEAVRDACLTLDESEQDRAGVSIGT